MCLQRRHADTHASQEPRMVLLPGWLQVQRHLNLDSATDLFEEVSSGPSLPECTQQLRGGIN